MMSNITPQQRWILAIVAFVGINVLVWLYGLSPTLDSIEAAEQRLSNFEQQRDQLQQQLDQLNAIDIEALEEQMSQYNILVPQQGYLRELVTELEQMTRGQDVELHEVSIYEPGVFEENPYLVNVLHLELSGGYRALITYLDTLEQHERMLFVDSFDLEIDTDDSIQGSFSIAVFAEDFDQITPHDAPGRRNPFGAN